MWSNIVRSYRIKTDKVLMLHQPDIVAVDKQRKTNRCRVLPSNRNIWKKEHVKLENYQEWSLRRCGG